MFWPRYSVRDESRAHCQSSPRRRTFAERSPKAGGRWNHFCPFIGRPRRPSQLLGASVPAAASACTKFVPITESAGSEGSALEMKAELSHARAGRPEPLQIAPMAHGDIGDVLTIERASFATTWPADAFYNELHTNKLAHYYVGHVGEEFRRIRWYLG